jgi:protein CrcB
MTGRQTVFQRWLSGQLAMYLVVAVGAAIGGVMRAGVSIVSLEYLGAGFPWGTLAANVAGSFAIGFYAALTGPDGRLLVGTRQRQFVMTGICGGFTTLSVFSLESFSLLASGDHRLAAANVGGSVIAWLLAVSAGHALAMRLIRLDGRRRRTPPKQERTHDMQLPEQALALRIFIGEDDKDDGRPLYEAIVLKAREMHLAGATVLRGPLGYGHSSRLHTSKILRLSEDLPLVIEIVDSEEKINAFLPELDRLMTSGLITVENVRVLQYGVSRGASD